MFDLMEVVDGMWELIEVIPTDEPDTHAWKRTGVSSLDFDALHRIAVMLNTRETQISLCAISVQPANGCHFDG